MILIDPQPDQKASVELLAGLFLGWAVGLGNLVRFDGIIEIII